MDQSKEICYTTGLARDGDKLRTVVHEDTPYYVAELRGNDTVLASRLIPTDTHPGVIRQFLTEWGREHYEIAHRAVAVMLDSLS